MSFESAETKSFPFKLAERIEINGDKAELHYRLLWYSNRGIMGLKEESLVEYINEPTVNLQNEEQKIHYCKLFNDRGTVLFVEAYERFRKAYKESDGIYKVNLENYYKNIRQRFIKWYLHYEIPYSPPSIIPNKENWKMNKKAFAFFILKEFEANPNNYTSLKKASDSLFDIYNFTFEKWTKIKCYNNVKKYSQAKVKKGEF